MNSAAEKPVSSSARPGQNHVFSGVFELLQPHFSALDRFLHVQLEQFEPEIREMVRYCVDSSGKRIRPALVFLSGWSGEGKVAEPLIRAAAVVELVHLATLVHDDIMDGAEVRRSRLTAARAYGSTAAVLLGDALFAHALNLATTFPTAEVCAAVSESTRRVCAGEIVQTLRRGSPDLRRADYDRIIDLKTAELFRVSCFLGSRLAGSPADYTGAVSRFGRHLGIAYQIYDDLVDFFGEEARTGKTLGTDFASGKVTLPVLELIQRLPAADAAGLRAELAGSAPGDMARRLGQMRQLGVLPAVSLAVEHELDHARQALAPWGEAAPTARLLALAELLHDQVAAVPR
jgi:octaprenyl-diphosphate synthase